MRHAKQIVGGGTERGMLDGEEMHREKGTPTDIINPLGLFCVSFDFALVLNIL